MRCLAAKHAELKEGAMREDAALAASKRRICMRYGFWRRFSIGDDWGGEAASGMYCAGGARMHPQANLPRLVL